MKMKKVILVLGLCAVTLTGCKAPEEKAEQVEPENEKIEVESSEEVQGSALEKFADIRYIKSLNFPDQKEKYISGEYIVEDIPTYTFNEGTILVGSEEIQKKVMEGGKKPGLGVRAIHEKGITGKGVNVAIIDQNMYLNHPEYSGKILEYFDTGCNAEKGSMHAPAVTSLLIGEEIGVAPGARAYVAAAPSWLGDSKYYADGLNWIIEENKKLPEGEKIRVVSVSASPSGEGSPFEKNLEMWDEAVAKAKEEGILVLDCRGREETGFLVPAYFDSEDRDDITKCKGGFPNSPGSGMSSSEYIGVPLAYRTVAEEYVDGEPSYTYCGTGGLSWGIPYGAGVLALGWEVNPELSNEEILQILFDTAYVNDEGFQMINPTAFIEAVEGTVK